jgi:tetratricopeptide (TPR) repeat protein
MPIGLGALGAALPKSKKEKKTEDADARRAEGNEKFARGDYAGAIAAYEEALALNANDASARSNKAECYLRGRMFDKALECAEGAAECASGNKGTKLKAMYKKAMALNGLARYGEAGRVAEEALKLATEEEDAPVRATLEKVKLECEMLKEQAFTGVYDLGALYLNRMGTSFRRCAEHVGSVKVSKLSDGRRGVVTTSAVKAGDLLAVQAPLSVASFSKTTEQNLVRGLYEAARANSTDWAILKSLPTSVEDEQNDAPDTNLFRKHLGTAVKAGLEIPEKPEELAFLPKVVSNCAISGRKLAGVWPLPSFMNHSCAPNAHRINVGQVMLIFASKDIPSGSEVTIKYYDTLIPKKDRAAFASKRGYACNCARCAFESTGDVSPEEKAKLEAAGKDEGAGPITRVIGALKRKVQPVFKTLKEEVAMMKKTKGAKVPNPNPLIELRAWFEGRLAALGLDETQLAMARMSCYSMYESLSLALSLAGAGDLKHQLTKQVLSDLNIVEPGGFAACKQSTMLANNARRVFGKESKEVMDATNAMVEAHQLRYGAVDQDDLIELVRRTEQSISEETGEFCEL